ncbi:glycine cleavage system aminomethyltransferase GcvT [bacterium]|nr:glycine cleavage system aminomethyltransferase GcvT [bacterium]
MEDLKRTPLFEVHKQMGGNIVSFAGWEMPVWYTSINEEHNAVRERAGLFDVSHMGEVLALGPDAVKFADHLIANSVSKLELNQICYSPMCNKNGGVVDDLLAYKFSDSKVMLVVNASNTDKDFNWIVSQKGNYDVELTNISSKICQLALQGPKAEEILQKLTNFDLSKINFFHFEELEFKNEISAIVSRTGYTGEDGFEIYFSSQVPGKMWNGIIEAGKDEGVQPIGLGARDTLRFEAKLMLYGNELTDDITPLDAGLKWAIDLDKDFVGREPILKEKEEGLKRYLVGFEMNKKAIPRHGYKIVEGDKEIGWVTSGTVAPYLKKFLGLGYVPYDKRKRGNIITIDIRGRKVEATIVKTPFYKKQYKK